MSTREKLGTLCPHCKRAHAASPRLFGKRVQCPSCSNPFEVLRFEIPPTVLRAVPGPFAREHGALPLAFQDDALIVAVDAATEYEIVQKLEFLLNRAVRSVPGPPEAIRAEVARHYGTAAEPLDAPRDPPAAEDELADGFDGVMAILCICGGCGTRFALGVNAVAATVDEVLGDSKARSGLYTFGTPGPEIPDTIGLGPEAESWPEGVAPPVPRRPVPRPILEARQQKLLRRWVCDLCKQVQPYPWCPGGISAGPHTYRELDNQGTRKDTAEKAKVFWRGRQLSSNKEPFLRYAFPSEQAARSALLGLPCIHEAADTRKLICTEILTFGYYPVENGRVEAMVAGRRLTPDLFEQARDIFRGHGGTPQADGEFAPEPEAFARPSASGLFPAQGDDRGASAARRAMEASGIMAASGIRRVDPDLLDPSKIEFNCSECGRSLRVPVKYAGKQGKCPGCGNVTRIPGV
jgi:hypothetical protein